MFQYCPFLCMCVERLPYAWSAWTALGFEYVSCLPRKRHGRASTFFHTLGEQIAEVGYVQFSLPYTSDSQLR